MRKAIEIRKTPDEQAGWRFYEAMLQRLGTDGMSSDDSEGGGLEETTYRVRKMPWRRAMESDLATIDNERLIDADLFSQRGSKPGKRIRRDSLTSNRSPVLGLPKSLYNREWLKEQTPTWRRQNVSKEDFAWVRVVVDN